MIPLCFFQIFNNNSDITEVKIVKLLWLLIFTILYNTDSINSFACNFHVGRDVGTYLQTKKVDKWVKISYTFNV